MSKGPCRHCRALGVIVLIAAAIGVAFLGNRMGRDNGKATAAMPARADTSRAEGAAPLSEFAGRRTLVPDRALPSLSSRIVDIVPDLDARSRRGERAASCRMAIEADLCRRQDQIHDAIPYLEHLAATRDEADGEVAFIAKVESTDERAKAICADLPQEWGEREAWRYMLRAAQQGDVRMAVRFSTDPPMDRGAMLDNIQAWRAYAEYAPGLLKSAASAGDPAAFYYMQQIYAGRPVLIGMRNAIRPDPRKSAVYALVLLGFSDASTRADLDAQIDATKAKTTPSQWAEIEAEARELSRRHFSGQHVLDFDSGAFSQIQPQDCEAG